MISGNLSHIDYFLEEKNEENNLEGTEEKELKRFQKEWNL